MTTPTPTRGPCSPWDPIWCFTLTADAIPLTGSALMAATEILYNRTGQIFDICEFTVRPCRRDCFDDNWWGAGFGGYSGGPWWQWGGIYPRPALLDGAWYNLTCGGCSGSCSCVPLSIAYLPNPVASITQVKLNGAVLAASGYRVDNYRELVRLGGATWPICQDMTKADTETNTWSVTVRVGETPPVTAQYAVGELAAEIIKSCLGQPCILPRNAVTVNRQGVTVDLVSIYELLDRGLLGLTYSDLLISTYNPHRLMSRPQVYDVDGPQPWRRTTFP